MTKQSEVLDQISDDHSILMWRHFNNKVGVEMILVRLPPRRTLAAGHVLNLLQDIEPHGTFLGVIHEVDWARDLSRPLEEAIMPGDVPLGSVPSNLAALRNLLPRWEIARGPGEVAQLRRLVDAATKFTKENER